MKNNNQTVTAVLQPEVVVKHTCLLGEGPVWDAKRQTICWVDILKGEIHEFSPEQKTLRTIPVHQMIGAVALCTNGNFVAALQNGLGFVDRESGEVSIVSDPEVHLPNNRFNEGKCDTEGRFWAGTMSLSEEESAGSLYIAGKDLSVTKKIAGVTISNGMAWSVKHGKFYFIDTPTFEVATYDYDKTTASIKNRKTAIKVPEEDGHPDGMTIDNEGMLWIAHFNGWQVTRWNAETGQKLHTVKLPVSQVTSCTFGGANLDDLYITTASKELSEEQLQEQPLAGSLFVVRNCGFTGLPAFMFKA